MPIVYAVVAEQVVDMKKNGVKRSTFRIALCGVISALSLALMVITSIVPFGTYAFPCFAGVLLIAVVIEFGVKWAFGVYAVVAIMSLLFAGDKEAVLYFITILGYYPVIKGLIEGKIKNKFVQYVIKFAVFNMAVITAFFISIYILSIPTEEFTIFGFYVPYVFLIAANIFFLVYDFAVTIFVMQYVRRIRIVLFKKWL